MSCFSSVTLSLPLLCLKVQMYIPLSCGWTGLMCKLPLERCVTLALSNGVSSCLFHAVCGAGVPSARQLIIPELLATILCSGFKSVNLAFGSNIYIYKLWQWLVSYDIILRLCWVIYTCTCINMFCCKLRDNIRNCSKYLKAKHITKDYMQG